MKENGKWLAMDWNRPSILLGFFFQHVSIKNFGEAEERKKTEQENWIPANSGHPEFDIRIRWHSTWRGIYCCRSVSSVSFFTSFFWWSFFFIFNCQFNIYSIFVCVELAPLGESRFPLG